MESKEAACLTYLFSPSVLKMMLGTKMLYKCVSKFLDYCLEKED